MSAGVFVCLYICCCVLVCFVCFLVRMSMCRFVCVNLRLFVDLLFISVCCVCVHACTFVRAHERVCLFARTCVWTFAFCIRVRAFMCLCAYLRLCLCRSIYVYMYACECLCVCVSVCVCVH